MGIVRCPPWILPLFAHTLCCPNQIDDDQSGNVDFHNSDSDIMIDVLGEIFMKLELDQTLMIGMYTKNKLSGYSRLHCLAPAPLSSHSQSAPRYCTPLITNQFIFKNP